MKTVRMNVAKMRSILAGMAIAIIALAFACIACKNEPTPPHIPTTIEVSFVSLGTFSSPFPTVIDFSPNRTLPTGITYKLTDNRPTSNTWNSANGFNGKVNVTTYNGLSDTNVTFTQTFYFNGVEITGTGSKRTVVVSVDNFPDMRFIGKVSDTGSVMLTY